MQWRDLHVSLSCRIWSQLKHGIAALSLNQSIQTSLDIEYVLPIAHDLDGAADVIAVYVAEKHGSYGFGTQGLIQQTTTYSPTTYTVSFEYSIDEVAAVGLCVS